MKENNELRENNELIKTYNKELLNTLEEYEMKQSDTQTADELFIEIESDIRQPFNKTTPITKWNERIDFSGISLIGFETKQAHVLAQKENKIFVHFDQAASLGAAKRYQWINVPNNLICKPPEHQHFVSMPRLDIVNIANKLNINDLDCTSIKDGCIATHRMINALIYYSDRKDLENNNNKFFDQQQTRKSFSLINNEHANLEIKWNTMFGKNIDEIYPQLLNDYIHIMHKHRYDIEDISELMLNDFSLM
eukprot:93205_1